MDISERAPPAWLDDQEMRTAYGSAMLTYDLAATLVAARRQAQLTQHALADLAGVSQAYLAKVERGRANPSLGDVGVLFAAMGLRLRLEVVAIQAGDDR